MLRNSPLRFAIPLAFSLAAVGLAVLVHDGLSAYQASARFTGRVSLGLFAMIAVLYALPAHRAAARLLMAPFAAVHLVHFACLATYLRVLGEWPMPVRLLGGGAAYAMIVAMPFFQRAVGLRERARVVVESVYFGFVGFIFGISYVLRLLGKVPEAGGTRAEHVALLGFVVATACMHAVLRLRGGVAGTAR